MRIQGWWNDADAEGPESHRRAHLRRQMEEERELAMENKKKASQPPNKHKKK